MVWCRFLAIGNIGGISPNVSGRDTAMAIPFDPKEIVTVQELAISNMLEIEAKPSEVYGKEISKNQ